jgi:hypothetical protein
VGYCFADHGVRGRIPRRGPFVVAVRIGSLNHARKRKRRGIVVL